MKKKIKDLTLEELLNICIKYSCVSCVDCPLNDIICDKYFNISNLYDMKLNKKIEVKDYVDQKSK